MIEESLCNLAIIVAAIAFACIAMVGQANTMKLPIIKRRPAKLMGKHWYF